MLVGVCRTKNNINAHATCDAFYNGVINSGDQAILIDESNQYELKNVDVLFQICLESIYENNPFRWAVSREANRRNIKRIIADVGFFSKCNKRTLVEDIDRYLAISIGGIKNSGKYYNEDSAADRFNIFNFELKSWKTDGQYFLILGQNERGLSVQDINYPEWLNKTVSFVSRFGPVVLRKHPNQNFMPRGKYEVSDNVDISKDLENARCTISYSTNSAIDGIIDGVTALVGSRNSMLWRFYNDITENNLVNIPVLVDRTQCLHDLAYAQYNLKELEQGMPWQKFRKFIND